ncbi:hypothetical protein HC256_006835 [Beauveria bassiana]|nr:hypothetical protein HC256_006835 [Beauveria bassiana]
MFIVFGVLNSYGRFRSINETDLLRYKSAPGFAKIGSALFLLCYLVRIFVSLRLNNGHHPLLGVETVRRLWVNHDHYAWHWFWSHPLAGFVSPVAVVLDVYSSHDWKFGERIEY